jgi:hypothetical protein
VIASDLRPELNKPYYVAVSVKIADGTSSGITFYLQDLSDSKANLQTASAEHGVTADYRAHAALTIGGRDRNPEHRWHGLIDDVRISAATLSADELLIGKLPNDKHTVGHWRFEKENFLADASPAKNDIQPLGASTPKGDSPEFAALVDFCHALLNSNEFLYVD